MRGGIEMAEMTINQKLVDANIAMMNKKFDLELENYLEDHELTPKEAKLNELKDNEAFMKKVVQSDTPKEMQEVFKDAGVDFTMEEVTDFIKAVQDGANKILNATEELSDDELEQITGGSLGRILGWVVSAVIGVAIGVAIAAATIATCGAALAIGGGIILAASITGFGGFLTEQANKYDQQGK